MLTPEEANEMLAMQAPSLQLLALGFWDRLTPGERAAREALWEHVAQIVTNLKVGNSG